MFCIRESTKEFIFLKNIFSRSSSNPEGVTSIPDPSLNLDRRSSSNNSCSHLPNNVNSVNSNVNQTTSTSSTTSGSRNRRRRSAAGRRRSGSSGNRRMAASDPVTNPVNGSTNPANTAAVTVPEEEDLTRIGPQDEAQRAQVSFINSGVFTILYLLFVFQV
jgi:hypothetical protein